METSKIALFKGNKIRKVIYENEWWFSVIDVVEALTGTDRSRKYWNDLKIKLINEGDTELSEKIGQLKLASADGKKYLTDCANTETIFRIIQSIPSPKAEPFKRWLAKIGYERVQEIEDPELATKRTRATFGVTPSEYRNLKGLKRENLRDHMDDFELIFTMFGERATTEIHTTEDSKGFAKLKEDAKDGGETADVARKKLEKRLGRPVVSSENYLGKPEDKKLI